MSSTANVATEHTNVTPPIRRHLRTADNWHCWPLPGDREPATDILYLIATTKFGGPLLKGNASLEPRIGGVQIDTDVLFASLMAGKEHHRSVLQAVNFQAPDDSPFIGMAFVAADTSVVPLRDEDAAFAVPAARMK